MVTTCLNREGLLYIKSKAHKLTFFSFRIEHYIWSSISYKLQRKLNQKWLILGMLKLFTVRTLRRDFILQYAILKNSISLQIRKIFYEMTLDFQRCDWPAILRDLLIYILSYWLDINVKPNSTSKLIVNIVTHDIKCLLVSILYTILALEYFLF